MGCATPDMENLLEWLEQLYSVLFLGANIASLGIPLVFLVIGSIVVILSFLITVTVAIVLFILKALPVYKLAKKLGRKNAWLAWVPIFGEFFRLYVLCDAAGDKPFSLFGGKWVIKSRNTSFLICLAIAILGPTLIVSVISLLSLVPLLNYLFYGIGSLLHWVPVVFCAFFEYVYLKDALDLFKEDQSSNRIAAIVIIVLDTLLTGELAKTVWLYTLMKRSPLPTPEEFCQTKQYTDGACYTQEQYTDNEYYAQEQNTNNWDSPQ